VSVCSPGRLSLRWSPILVIAVLLAVGVARANPALAAAPGPAGAQQPEPFHVRGQVVDARHVSRDTVVPTGLAPVSRATVRIPTFSIGAPTDRSGRFDLRVSGDRRSTTTFEVTVTAPGFGAWRMTGIAVPVGGDDPDLLVQLTTTGQQVAYPPSRLAHPQAQPQSRGRAGLVGPAASSSCTGFYSDSSPPSTIRVLLTGSGQIQTYDFNFYVKHVLPREWIASWLPDSLMAGAMAVKSYGWFWVNHWRGGAVGSQCYDVDDTTNYQVFNPNLSASSTDAAVDATWSSLLLQNGLVLEASYCSTMTCNPSGSDSCGQATTGSRLSQTGSQACASQGMGWRQILQLYYYPGVTITTPAAPPSLPGNPMAVVYGTQFHVVVHGTDGAVWHDVYDSAAGRWSGWQSLGGGILGDPMAVVYGSQFQVVAHGTDGAVWQDVYDSAAGRWSGWQSLGGGVVGSPVAVVYGSQFHVVAQGTDGAAWHDVYDPSTRQWSGWQSLGGAIAP